MGATSFQRVISGTRPVKAFPKDGGLAVCAVFCSLAHDLVLVLGCGSATLFVQGVRSR